MSNNFAREVMQAIDLDGTGLITKAQFHKAFSGKRKKEFRRLLGAVGQDWKRVFCSLDKDDSGTISMAELQSAIVPPAATDHSTLSSPLAASSAAPSAAPYAAAPEDCDSGGTTSHSDRPAAAETSQSDGWRLDHATTLMVMCKLPQQISQYATVSLP